MSIDESDIGPLRIAFYGYAERDAGSVSSAGYVILRELLQRGHQIDFFGKRSFAFPVGLDSFPNFRFVDAEGPIERRLGEMCKQANRLTTPILGRLLSDQTRRNIPTAMRSENLKRNYDICLYFGTWSFGRVASLPTVNWVQGAPESDGRSVFSRAREIIDLAGVRHWILLRAYALYRSKLGRPRFINADVVILGSQWSRHRLATYGIPIDRIHPLPYPIDLTTFQPASPAEPRRSFPSVVLWLGRIVPRKRLDLLLDSCAQLIGQGRDLKVVIAGGFGFVPQYRKLLDRFPYPQHLQYIQRLDRSDVIPLIQSASVLVQPSKDEDFGSSVAEALACGTPVVLGPTNGTSDYIADAGVRFAHYDAASVAEAIASVLDGVAAEPATWTARARAAAERFCDVQRIVSELERLLRLASAHLPLAETARRHPLDPNLA